MSTPSVYPQFLKVPTGSTPSLYPQFLWPIVVPVGPPAIPDEWAYPGDRWFVGDRMPALAYPFTTVQGYAILGDIDYTHYFNLNRPSGVTAVVDVRSFLVSADNGEPIYLYTWTSGGLDVTGRHKGQFKSVRQNKTIYADRFNLIVRPPI